MPFVDELVIVNDGYPYPENVYPNNAKVIQHLNNKGIAKTKNDALRYLYEKNCEYMFLSEDDVIINGNNIFAKYIMASELSGIKHFNFGYVKENLGRDGNFLIKKIIDYSGIRIAFFNNLSGTFSYFHREVIESVGYMDENFKNALEHVDHTYQIIKSGFHPPLRWFADILDSNQFLIDQDELSKNSLIQNIKGWKIRVYYNSFMFFLKNKYFPWNLPEVNEVTLNEYLKNAEPSSN